MKLSQRDYKRVVIKVGSSILFSDKKGLNYNLFKAIGHQVNSLLNEGREVILVSSGAIAFGLHKFGLKERPKELYILQAAAAIGQNLLMHTYRKLVKTKIHVAQILLTRDDFNDRRRYLNARNTICTLLKYGSVPIVNENDTVSTEEIKFGDNDRLSAMVASLISADILIILSDVDGLLDKDNKVIGLVTQITPVIKSLACPTDKKTCVGGMITKIEAANIAMNSGIPCIIANGLTKDIILSTIKEPGKSGTLFMPKKSLKAREHWLAFGAKPKGNITVDDGAKEALLAKKSLLAVGVVAVEGDFKAGDIVGIRDKSDNIFAKGKVRLSSPELEKVKGSRGPKEVAHRDNIVIL